MKAYLELEANDDATLTVKLSFGDDKPPAGLSAKYNASDDNENPHHSVLTLTPSDDNMSCHVAVDQERAKALDTHLPLPSGLTVHASVSWKGQTTPAVLLTTPPFSVAEDDGKFGISLEDEPEEEEEEELEAEDMSEEEAEEPEGNK